LKEIVYEFPGLDDHVRLNHTFLCKIENKVMCLRSKKGLCLKKDT
jgi:hypothetical protein